MIRPTSATYALLQVRDVLARLDGVGDITLFGLREYQHAHLAGSREDGGTLNMTASDVVQALREQNVQVAAGVIGQPPVPQGNRYQLSVSTLGRLMQRRTVRRHRHQDRGQWADYARARRRPRRVGRPRLLVQ